MQDLLRTSWACHQRVNSPNVRLAERSIFVQSSRRTSGSVLQPVRKSKSDDFPSRHFRFINFVFLNSSQKYKGEGKKGKWDKEDGMEIDNESGAESSLSPSETPGSGDGDDGPKVDPIKWTVSFRLFPIGSLQYL